MREKAITERDRLVRSVLSRVEVRDDVPIRRFRASGCAAAVDGATFAFWLVLKRVDLGMAA
jgi:hypothetical protein